MSLDSLVDIVSNNVGILIILAAFMALLVLVDPASNPPNDPAATEQPAKKLLVPWSHVTNKQTLYFALRRKRLYTMDLRPFFQELLTRRPTQDRKPVTFNLPQAAVRYFPVTNQVYCLEFTLTEGGGESWLAAQGGESAWSSALRRHGPEQFTPFFWVSGDSFELFRELRQNLWEDQYEVGWRPVADESPLEVCTGFENSRSFQPQ